MPGPRSKYAVTLTREHETRLQQLSHCYMAPFVTVQRAQRLLLGHRYPEWSNAALAQQIGCHRNTVRQWQQRWPGTDSLRDAPRAGHTPENLAVLHHIALNLLRQDTTVPIGIQNKRLKAGWDEPYLEKLLFGHAF